MEGRRISRLVAPAGAASAFASTLPGGQVGKVVGPCLDAVVIVTESFCPSSPARAHRLRPAAFSALCLAPTNRTDLAGRADLSDQPTTQTAQTFQTVTKNDGAGGVLLKDIADAGDRPVTGRLDQFHRSPLHSVVGFNVNRGSAYVPVSRQRLQHTNAHAFASKFGDKARSEEHTSELQSH